MKVEIERFLESPALSPATRRAYGVDVREFARWLDAGTEGQTGYRIFNNVTSLPGGPYFPISYGVNADIEKDLAEAGVHDRAHVREA